MKKGLLWLRNDLRLADNPALHRALAECGEVLFVYVFDERTWNPNRMGPFRAQFQHESLIALREKITGRGGKIEFVRGMATRWNSQADEELWGSGLLRSEGGCP